MLYLFALRLSPVIETGDPRERIQTMVIGVAIGCLCVGLVVGIGFLLWVASEPEKLAENQFQRYKRYLENRKFYEPRR